MNDKARTPQEAINDLVSVAASPGNAHANDYMRGMANGLLVAQSVFTGEEPKFIEPDAVFDYAREAEKTCSIIFGPEHVGKDDFVMTLRSVIVTAERMNLFKKLFFRGKTPAEIGMVAPDYQRSLAPLLERCTADEINIIHGVIGSITEVGEMAELLMAFIQGNPFDRVHVLEESGDVSWYIQRCLRGIGATTEVMDRANIDKLHGRHGEAFDVFRDANRNLDVEREKLEVAAAPLFEAPYGSKADGTPKELEDLEDLDNPDQRPAIEREIDRVEKRADLGDLAAIPARVRNDPPLPPGVAPNVGNGSENVVKTNVGDCEGMDC
jgi:hypothetical protein